VSRHNFQGDFQYESGHFSQLVWKSSREVGFGIAKDNRGIYYAVANYHPAGNIMTFFQQNVSP
jgi:hypothetical protein